MYIYTIFAYPSQQSNRRFTDLHFPRIVVHILGQGVYAGRVPDRQDQAPVNQVDTLRLDAYLLVWLLVNLHPGTPRFVIFTYSAKRDEYWNLIICIGKR